MARTTNPLTSIEVKDAEPKAKEYSLADGNGLYLRVKPSGSKLWIFNYSRPFTRIRTNISVGQYPTISLAKARVAQQQNLALLSDNIDPRSHKAEQQRLNTEAPGNTLKKVTNDWFQVKKTKVTRDYADDIYRSLELHIFPKIGDMPIHKIRALDAIEILKPISAKGSLETLKRLCQRLNEVMVYATNTGLIYANPLSGISKAFESPIKKPTLTLKPEQLPELMAAIVNAPIKKTTKCLLEWQLHTMTRSSEAAGTKWEEIDLDKKLWTLPAERMTKKRSHSIPLSHQAISLLKGMMSISHNRVHVFPADGNPREHTHQQTVNMALKRMGFGGILVAHGMRALASTILSEQGFESDLIKAALANTDKNDVRMLDNQDENIERRKAMMSLWSIHIDNCSQLRYFKQP